MGIVSARLDSEKFPKEVIDPEKGKLVLIDGREIELYPKQEKSEIVVDG